MQRFHAPISVSCHVLSVALPITPVETRSLTSGSHIAMPPFSRHLLLARWIQGLGRPGAARPCSASTLLYPSRAIFSASHCQSRRWRPGARPLGHI
jgi:hypothetical protein